MKMRRIITQHPRQESVLFLRLLEEWLGSSSSTINSFCTHWCLVVCLWVLIVHKSYQIIYLRLSRFSKVMITNHNIMVMCKHFRRNYANTESLLYEGSEMKSQAIERMCDNGTAVVSSKTIDFIAAPWPRVRVPFRFACCCLLNKRKRGSQEHKHFLPFPICGSDLSKA